MNGVTTLDILLIQRHILGIAPFTEARQEIAADVNRDGSIDNADVLEIWRFILGHINNWTVGENLIFLPEFEYSDAELAMPGLDPILLSWYGHYPNCSGYSDLNRRVIKTGDVNGTFSF